MKRWHFVLTGLFASGPLLLLPADAQAGGFSTPPDPTLTSTITASDVVIRSETVSFSGADYCGNAWHPTFGPIVSVACGHTVFIGIWQPSPGDYGGSWSQSVTLLSTPGGFNTVTSSVGLVSGSFTVGCNSGNGELYAYDLDEGTLITGASVNALSCLVWLGGL